MYLCTENSPTVQAPTAWAKSERLYPTVDPAKLFKLEREAKALLDKISCVKAQAFMAQSLVVAKLGSHHAVSCSRTVCMQRASHQLEELLGQMP